MDIQIIIRWAFGIFVAGILFIGGVVLLFAKIKINYSVGYVSKLSVKNEFNWKYANRVFALLLLIVGSIIAIETIIINLLKLDIKIFMPVIKNCLCVCICRIYGNPAPSFCKRIYNPCFCSVINKCQINLAFGVYNITFFC